MSYDMQSRMVEVDWEGILTATVEWVVIYWTHSFGPDSKDGFIEVFSSRSKEVAEDFLFSMKLGRGMRVAEVE